MGQRWSGQRLGWPHPQHWVWRGGRSPSMSAASGAGSAPCPAAGAVVWRGTAGEGGAGLHTRHRPQRPWEQAVGRLSPAASWDHRVGGGREFPHQGSVLLDPTRMECLFLGFQGLREPQVRVRGGAPCGRGGAGRSSRFVGGRGPRRPSPRLGAEAAPAVGNHVISSCNNYPPHPPPLPQ